MGDSRLPQLNKYHVKTNIIIRIRKRKSGRQNCSMLENIRGIPVIRLLGSKTSIFSARSMAIGDILGNFSAKGCFGKRGSCLTYFLALSLRRNPRSESSGEPNNYFGITMKIFISHHHNNISQGKYIDDICNLS